MGGVKAWQWGLAEVHLRAVVLEGSSFLHRRSRTTVEPALLDNNRISSVVGAMDTGVPPLATLMETGDPKVEVKGYKSSKLRLVILDRTKILMPACSNQGIDLVDRWEVSLSDQLDSSNILVSNLNWCNFPKAKSSCNSPRCSLALSR